MRRRLACLDVLAVVLVVAPVPPHLGRLAHLDGVHREARAAPVVVELAEDLAVDGGELEELEEPAVHLVAHHGHLAHGKVDGQALAPLRVGVPVAELRPVAGRFGRVRVGARVEVEEALLLGLAFGLGGRGSRGAAACRRGRGHRWCTVYLTRRRHNKRFTPGLSRLPLRLVCVRRHTALVRRHRRVGTEVRVHLDGPVAREVERLVRAAPDATRDDLLRIGDAHRRLHKVLGPHSH